MTMKKLTPAERTAQVNAWKYGQYEANKDDIEAYWESCCMETKARKKQYHQDNKKACNAWSKQYYTDHKEAIKARVRAYQRDHPRDPREYVTDAWMCTNLNKWFVGCRRHHIDADTIIHIPSELHVTHPHNIRTGLGMAEMNAMAYTFLNGQREASAQTSLHAFM